MRSDDMRTQLRRAFRESGLSRINVSHLAGVSRPTLGRLLSDREEVEAESLRKIEAIAAVLGLALCRVVQDEKTGAVRPLPGEEFDPPLRPPAVGVVLSRQGKRPYRGAANVILSTPSGVAR